MKALLVTGDTLNLTVLLVSGDAAKALGCSVQAVRKMEERGILRCQRTAGGFRLFDAAEVERVKVLRDARPTKWHPIEAQL